MATVRWLLLAVSLVASLAARAQEQSPGQTQPIPKDVTTPKSDLLSAANSDPETEARRAAALVNRQRAEGIELCDQHRYEEALPLLEKALAANSEDKPVLTALGISLVAESYRTKVPEQRKAQRVRGREILANAKKLGVQDDLVDYYLQVIPADGGIDTVFSDRKEVNDAMRQGEDAYAQKDFQGAVKGYTRAMLLDPGLYEPVLFIGTPILPRA